MVQQLPNGWRCAARALRLAVACAILAWTVPASALEQEFVSDGEVSHGDGGHVFAPPGYVPDGETPDWMATYNEYCQDGCDGSHGDCIGCDCDSDCIAGDCAGGERWWFAAEYLLWRTDSTVLPPLATDSPRGTAPVLNQSTTQVLAGNHPVANHWRSGYKFELGIWLGDCNDLAVVGDYFNIGQDDYDFYFPGDSGRNTGRPYFNTELGVQDFLPISGAYLNVDGDPFTSDGTISIQQDDEFHSAGIILEQTIYSVGMPAGVGPGTQVILLGGYRYYGYDSRLAIDSTSTIVSGAGGGSFEVHNDLFTSDNEFHGGEIGIRARVNQKACWFDGSFKLAIGGHSRQISVDGASVIADVGVPAEFSEGGWLTSAETNIGDYGDTRARLIPEFRLGFGVYLTPQWVIRGGYTAIVWSGVARAAGALPPNLEVDPRNEPGGTIGVGGVSPYFPGVGGSELVANGLDLGLEYNY